MDCIFCKIINKELPAVTLIEDDGFLVILDKFPQTKGHALIIPKVHSRDLFDLDKEGLERILKLAVEVGNKLRGAVNYDGLNLIQSNGEAAGQTVFHFHLHLIPRYHGDNVPLSFRAVEADTSELCAIRDRFSGFDAPCS